MQATMVAQDISVYGDVLVNGLYFLIGGTIAIYLMNRIAKRFLYPVVGRKPLIHVIFGTAYVLIFVVAILLVLKRRGFDVEFVGQLAIILVLFCAVAIYFLIPYFPRLPFMIGHMVEVNGILGVVDAISPFHTHIRTFDGKMAFVPNALIAATKIINYSHLPNRRIEIPIRLSANSNLEETQNIALDVLKAEQAVLADPEPAVLFTSADAKGMELMCWCWVKNDDFLFTRSRLWVDLMSAFEQNPDITLSLPSQEIVVTQTAG